jgi:hypothetical protein
MEHLLDLWEKSPETLESFTVEQIVSFSGDGKLRDGSDCSREFRKYISRISSEKIESYITYCLAEKFEKSGQVLQDLVNEIGRRLDYEVENGLYSGRQNEIGNDGLWRSPEGSHLIVEVKTTDAYRISLDTIAGYRQAHISNRSINERSSILIVVGRQDTGELEAQVRGSRHAWDVRLISAEALVKLALLKERSEKPETGSQIRSILVPVEYTRVDALVDVVFTAARDVEEADVEPEKIEKYLDQSEVQSGNLQYSKREIQEKRERIVERFSQVKSTHFIKKSRAILWSPDGEIAIACTVSKRYERGNPYWYAYHPAWRDFLNSSGEGFFILGCMDKDEFFAIPSHEMERILPQLHTTETDKQMYWHIQLREGRSGSLELVVPQGDSLQLDKYAFSLGI